jgi:hypothetical protein
MRCDKTSGITSLLDNDTTRRWKDLDWGIIINFNTSSALEIKTTGSI